MLRRFGRWLIEPARIDRLDWWFVRLLAITGFVHAIFDGGL